ncbi:MAG TPA: septum formation family protein [Candidatus Limnocylindrales bacterium]
MKTLAALAVSIDLVAVVSACQNIIGSTPLKVGDCFNYLNTTDANGDSINVPAAVDCARPHSDEVFSVFDYPNASGFPGYEQIGTVQQSRCEADFATYVGTTYDKTSYTINYDAPDEQAWATGDHQIMCLPEDAKGGQLTGSARGTKK